MNQKGAQDPRFIRDPDETEYQEIVSGSNNNIKRWSAAPELKGSLKFGRYLRSKDILPSIAHSDATYKEVYDAFENGFTHLTHFYSAMDVITAVPRFPHPMIPTLMAELTRDLKTISGFRIVNAETVAAFLRKVLLCIAEIL